MSFVIHRLIGREFSDPLVQSDAKSFPFHVANRGGKPAIEIGGNVLFWVVILISLTTATQILGLSIASAWLTGLTLYLPRILSAIVITFATLVGAVLLRDIVRSAAGSAGMAYASTLGRLAQVAAVSFGVLVAIDQLGLNILFLTNVLITVIGVILLGAALAFGMGARGTVDNILACHYLQKTYAVGHNVRIGDLQGEIVQITALAVVLKSDEDRISVPAKLFNESHSILLARGA